MTGFAAAGIVVTGTSLACSTSRVVSFWTTAITNNDFSSSGLSGKFIPCRRSNRARSSISSLRTSASATVSVTANLPSFGATPSAPAICQRITISCTRIPQLDVGIGIRSSTSINLNRYSPSAGLSL